MLPSLNICIPVTSESHHLPNRIKAALEWDGWKNYEGNVLVVIDGGLPDLAEQIRSIFHKDTKLVIMELEEASGADECLLCALKHSAAKYNVTVDPFGIFMLRDIELLLNVHQRSNCQVIYGYTEKITSWALSNFIYKLKAYIFSFFTGMPACISDFRLISQSVTDQLMEENQQSFILDKSLLSKGTVYAGVPVLLNPEFLKNREGSRFLKTKMSMENLISASVIPELLMVLLLLLNIYFLFHGWIWQSLAIAIAVAIAMVNVYNVKWKIIRSYKLKSLGGS